MKRESNQEKGLEAESLMASRKQKKAALYENLELLRAATHSTAESKTSILVDASKYIEELKGKVESLNQEIETTEAASSLSQLPVVTVETLEKGFLINVSSEKNCPGLLVSILEAFDEIGLEVLDARISCSDNFQLEAVGGENVDSIDGQMVEQAVLQAINKWRDNNEQD